MNGCPGQLSGTAGAPITNWPSFAVVDVQGSCATVPTGKVTFSSSPVTGSDTYYVLKAEGSGEYDFQPNFEIVGPDVFAFGFLEPGNYWLMHRLGLTYSLLQGGGCRSDSILVTISNYGPTCGTISGSTYMDYNSDCIDTEVNAMNVVVEVQPGPIYTTSGGSYSMVVPNGSYTMTTSGAAIAQSCPAAATVNGNTVTANIGHQPTIPLDVAIGLASGPARLGFELHYTMTVANMSSSASGATITIFTFDPAVSFISAIPAPTTISGSTLIWNQPSLDIFQEREYQIRLQVPPDVTLINTELVANASVSTANMDGDLSNNLASASVIVTGSYDPNDKTASTSTRFSDEIFFIDQDQWIDYVIRFQNTGTDTAFNIVVTDTFPVTLDPASISLVSASHQHLWSLQDQGTLKFIFPNILLPDSTVNEAASHGLIGFRIRPRQPVMPGTMIENIANIYFDFNPPVITEPSVLVAEISTGQEQAQQPEQLIVFPNPAHDRIRLVLPQEIADPVLVEVLTVDGRRAMIARVDRDAEFSVDGLTEGIYLLRVRNDQGVLITRLVKH